MDNHQNLILREQSTEQPWGGTRAVVAALFTGGGRLRGSAENKSRGLGVKASRTRCAAVLRANGAVLGYRVGKVQGRVGPGWRYCSDGVVPTH
jgi:hypothetical protein